MWWQQKAVLGMLVNVEHIRCWKVESRWPISETYSVFLIWVVIQIKDRNVWGNSEDLFYISDDLFVVNNIKTVFLGMPCMMNYVQQEAATETVRKTCFSFKSFLLLCTFEAARDSVTANIQCSYHFCLSPNSYILSTCMCSVFGTLF